MDDVKSMLDKLISSDKDSVSFYWLKDFWQDFSAAKAAQEMQMSVCQSVRQHIFLS